MKIILINHYAGAHKYGMEFRPLYLAREWVRAGHKVTILAADHSHIRVKNPELTNANLGVIDGLDPKKFKEEAIEGIRYIWCKTPSYDGNGAGRVYNIFIFLVRLFQLSFWLCKSFPADVIVTSSTYPMDIFPARWMKFIFSSFGKRHQSVKLIYEVHDLWPLSPIELGGMSPWHPFIVWVQGAEDLSYRWADKVVSMLPKTKEYMISRGMRPEKFFYIPNGIDFSEWELDSQTPVNIGFLRALSEVRSQFSQVIGYFGTHGLANALESFIAAAKLAQEEGISVAFVLVGSGPDKEALQELAKDNYLTNTFFFDPISKSEIPNALQLFDLLYIGLQRQRLFRFGISPNKLIDYMAAGKPILFAVEAGNDPVAESNCGISVAAENPEKILEGLKKFLALTEAEKIAMGMNGRDFVKKSHCYKKLADQFVLVMRS